MSDTDLGLRLGPLSVPVEEEVESMHLRFLSQPPTGNFMDAVFRFNNCILYRFDAFSLKTNVAAVHRYSVVLSVICSILRNIRLRWMSLRRGGSSQ